MDLQYISDFAGDVNKTNSLNDKIETIKKWYAKDKKKLVNHLMPIYDYRIQYYLTSKNILKNAKIVGASLPKIYNDFSVLLNDLASRKITGHEAIGMVNGFIAANPKHKDIILKIIDKDIKCRIDVSVINRATEDSIPSFDVALAEKFKDAKGKNVPDLVNGAWYGSRKMNGCRMITIVDDNGDVSCWSREGNSFTTVDKIIGDVIDLGLKSIVFDGEICLIKPNGDDDFSGIMQEIKKKDHTIQNARYKMFDCLTLQEFKAKTSVRTFSERLAVLNKIDLKGLKHLDVLEQWKLDPPEFAKRRHEALEKGWEGLIIRKDCAYRADRSWDIQKVKEFIDAEYVVEDVECADIPYLVNGKYVDLNVVKNLRIKHRGFPVDVGSGMDLDERKAWKKDPSAIIGKTILVRYFMETTNKQGTISLQFPTLQYVYEDGRNT